MIDIFNMVFEALNAIFSPLLALDPNPQNPALTVLVIAFIVSLITTIANKLLVDQDEMNEIQQKMKDYQKEVREAQKSGDGKKLAKLQASPISGLVISMPPGAFYVSLAPIWHFIGSFMYGGHSVGYNIGWLFWYFICTFGMSQILRKFLGFKQGF